MISTELRKSADNKTAFYIVTAALDEMTLGDFGAISQVPRLIAEKLADMLVEEARKKILGNEQTTNRIMNEVVVELSRRLARVEDKLSEPKK